MNVPQTFLKTKELMFKSLEELSGLDAAAVFQVLLRVRGLTSHQDHGTNQCGLGKTSPCYRTAEPSRA